jgi:hypothetical protein
MSCSDPPLFPPFQGGSKEGERGLPAVSRKSLNVGSSFMWKMNRTMSSLQDFFGGPSGLFYNLRVYLI